VTQVHASVREVAVLQQATQMILSSLDADTVLHHMLLVVRNYFGASRCAVYLVEEASKSLYCRAQNGYPLETVNERLPIGKDNIPGWAAFTCSPLYVPDANKEPRHKIAGSEVKAILALPLLVREKALGVLEICSERSNPFTSDAISLLSLFADQAAIALENARLYSTDLRRMRQIEIINLIARTAASAADTAQFFSTLAELISDTFEGTRIAIVICGPQNQLSVPAFAGVPSIEVARLSASRERGIVAEAFIQRSLAVANNVAERAGWPTCFAGSSAEMCIPLISLGEVMGAIVLARDAANSFTLDDRSMAQATADVCATAARNVQLAEELRRVANLDPLTGVFNQRYFHTAVAQEIPRARRHKKEFGLIMLDLRGFREVNLSLGVEAGDRLLRLVAESLKANLRNNDVIARYVGDRFALLLPEVDADGLVSVLGKLQQGLRQVRQSPSPTPVNATWAAVHYPQDGADEIELMKRLAEMLAKAKRQSSGASA
jgi:diguanylate cyclase (GGDEF)-like protein